MPEPFTPLKNKILFLFFLFCFIIIAYSNTFHAAWHLDDYLNIVHNDRLHISDLKIESIAKTIFIQNDQGKLSLYRPIAYLSFAINWYFNQDHVFGYHIFNVGIHLLNAFFLFLTTKLLLSTPNLKKNYQQNAFFIAFLSTTFWALNPIQTQAVTYIVQRMASMVAMFYILSIYFFVKARTGENIKQYIYYSAGCLICYLFAIGVKENGAILPLALVLIEIVCFLDTKSSQQRIRLIKYLCIAGFTIILFIFIGLALIQKTPLTGVINSYELRSFSMIERLLTQFRVLIFYLSQIFYPIPQRFSIAHEVVVSKSLLTPWTTLPSIVLIVSFLTAGFFLIRKKPLFALAILFYFLNHIIESSILPLELLFEHRNYLPSMFIFLPVSSGLVFLLGIYKKKTRLIYQIIIGFIIFLSVFFATGTYIRNMAWKTEKSLWTDALDKAPNSGRSAYNLANDYFRRVDGLNTAMALYQKSFDLSPAKPPEAKALALNGIAGIYYIRKDYEKAVFYSEKAVEIAPDSEMIRHSLVLSLLKIEKFVQALYNLDVLIYDNSRNIKYLLLKSIVLIKLEKPEEALVYLRRAMKIQPGNVSILQHIGKAFLLNGNFKKAEWFFLRGSQLAPNNIVTWLLLIETSICRENDTQLNKYLEQLFSRFTVEQVNNYLCGNASLSITSLTVKTEIIAPVITDYLDAMAMKFYNLSD